MDIDLDELAALDHAEALHDMELLAVRRLVSVDKGFRVQADGIHDERIALVMADGFSEPGRLHARGVLVRQIDVPHDMVALPDHQDFFRPLHNEERIDAMKIEGRNADWPAPRLAAQAALA